MERHYNERYFFSERAGGVKYMAGEEEREFGYQGGGIWNFERFLNKLRELLGTPDSLLDIGAGCGGLVATSHAMGIGALGLEFSEFAVKNPVLGAGAYIKRWDVEKIPWPVVGQYDWVTAIDLFEHLFEDKLDEVIDETKRVAHSYIIAKICTAQLPREVWVAKRGTVEEVRKQAIEEGFEWMWASGHVNSQFPEYWIEKFVDDEWRLLEKHSERLVGDLKLPADWRTTLILERIYQGPVEPMPVVIGEEYYNKDYFVTPRGKKYIGSDGYVHGWSYSNPEGEFTGAAAIAQGWKEVFDPKDMLDVGAGRGTFTAYARDVGIQAIGFDYSEWAVGEGRYPRCKEEWLVWGNALNRWPWGAEQFELVVALDFMEHIYEEDLDKVIAEMFRVTERYIFLQIATAGDPMGDGARAPHYTLRKGEPVPIELEQYVVAGHVTVKPEEWWYDRLDHEDWIPRRDMVQHFCGVVDNDIIANWLVNSIIILEKIG